MAEKLSSTPDAFERLRGALERAGIRYAVGGSWASTAFGDPRFTNDIDILADITPENLRAFLQALPQDFYADSPSAEAAIRSGKPFNVIHMPTVLKFDLFPANAFPIGAEELDRAVVVENTGLSRGPARFVTREDILLAKLHWFKAGGEVSEVQWRDIQGLVRSAYRGFDMEYLGRGAEKLGVRELLKRAFRE